MHSANSFFPTRAEITSRQQPTSKLYSLCREASSKDLVYATLDPNSSGNIFAYGEQSREVKRPVGGQDLFRRMDQAAQQRRSEGKKLRGTSRQYHSRNVHTSASSVNPNMKRTVTESDAVILDLRTLLKNPAKVTLSQELFKSHQNYQTIISQRHQRQAQSTIKRGLFRSLHNIQSKFVPNTTIQRIDRQVQEHHDKMAVLGEIDRSRPLVELCGDAYFQMTLRNRFEDDLKMPSYIYRIKDKLTENKVISQLRNCRPDLIERRQLVLKGHRRPMPTPQ